MTYRYIVGDKMIISLDDKNQVMEHLERIPMYIETMKYQKECLLINTFYPSKTYNDEVKCYMVVGNEIFEPKIVYEKSGVRFYFQINMTENKIPLIRFILKNQHQQIELKKKIENTHKLKVGKYVVRIVNQKFKLLSPRENIVYNAKVLLKTVIHS